MAVALRKVARLWIPAGPRNFRSCGGKLLKPLIFVALYLWSKIDASSGCVMRWLSGLVRGVYMSGGMSWLWNMFRLYSVSSSSGMPMSSVFFYFSIFQNFFGWYFSISGSSNYKCALLCLQMFLNMVYAVFVSACFLPCLHFVCLYSLFAFLQASSNQGARCFDQRFGFL